MSQSAKNGGAAAILKDPASPLWYKLRLRPTLQTKIFLSAHGAERTPEVAALTHLGERVCNGILRLLLGPVHEVDLERGLPRHRSFYFRRAGNLRKGPFDAKR